LKEMAGLSAETSAGSNLSHAILSERGYDEIVPVDRRSRM